MVNKFMIGAPLGLAGATVGFGVLGEAFDSPGLESAGQVTGRFISPAISIGMGGFLVNQMRGFSKENLMKHHKEDFHY